MPRPEDEQQSQQEGQANGDPLQQFVREFAAGVQKSTKANKPVFILLHEIMTAAAERDRLVRQLPEPTTYQESLQRPGVFFDVEPAASSGTVFSSTRADWNQGVSAPQVRGVRSVNGVAILLEPSYAASINPDEDYDSQVLGMQRITFTSSGQLTGLDFARQEKPLTPVMRRKLVTTLERIKRNVDRGLLFMQTGGQPPRR